MLKWIFPIMLALIYSCSTTSAEWTPWKLNTVPHAQQDWRFCHASLDGPGLHREGLCWRAQECRTKNPWYSKEQKECRPFQLFCAWGDIDCMELNGIFNKVIVDKERLK